MEKKILPKGEIMLEDKKNKSISSKQDGKKVILNLIKPPDTPIHSSAFDRRSYYGQFGWIHINDNVPYIFRVENTEVIALRIVNQKIFPPFFNVFKQELFDMFVLHSFRMTEVERRLYNEINFFHADCTYGLNSFQKDEQLLRLDDVINFHQFLTHIYNRMILKTKDLCPQFGYMTFNNVNNIVPFYKVNGVHCFPTIYFEGDMDYLTSRSKKVNNFIESVLRFLMKIQNVNVKNEMMNVINLDDVKKFFEPNTKYIESWILKEHGDFTNVPRTSESSILKVTNTDVPGLTAISENSVTSPAFKYLQGYEKVAIYCPQPNSFKT